MSKNYDELTFTDDFLFCKILSNDLDLCKDLLELLLGIKILKVELSEAQKAIDIKADARGVRFDVYVKDSVDTVYDLEMQVKDKSDLPKRSRYYQGMIDMNLIEKGSDYQELKRSYVIFICLKDHFKRNLPVYTFRNICVQDTGLFLGDDATKVFINASCTAADIPEPLSNFLRYLRCREATDKLTTRISDSVRQATEQQKWRTEYMTLEMHDNEIRKEAHEAGRAEGQTIGSLSAYAKLISDGVITITQAAENMDTTVTKLKADIKTVLGITL